MYDSICLRHCLLEKFYFIGFPFNYIILNVLSFLFFILIEISPKILYSRESYNSLALSYLFFIFFESVHRNCLIILIKKKIVFKSVSPLVREKKKKKKSPHSFVSNTISVLLIKLMNMPLFQK